MKKSLFSSGNASAKKSLYKKELFADFSEKSEKNVRTMIRKYLQSVVKSFISNNTLSEEQKTDFIETYNKYYMLNDFSVASIYDGSDEEYKEELKKLLSFIAPKDNNKKNK